MMHYTTELLDDNTLLFRFTVPAEEYTAALDDAWRTHKARYPVPGMRDGKAAPGSSGITAKMCLKSRPWISW